MSSFELLICGYLRNEEKDDEYSMNFWSGLNQIVLKYYPKLMSFCMYNSTHFVCEKKGKSIQGKGNTCNAFTIYIGYDTFMTDGFDEGVHYLSVQNNNHEGSGQCIHSIGVISEKQTKYVMSDKYALLPFYFVPNTDLNYFEGFPNHWVKGEVITIKLDMNQYEIVYYKNARFQYKQALNGESKYFFAMHLCASDDIHMQIVDNPRYFD